MINETERPNPRYISNRIFNAGERDIRSPSDQSQWVWTWGQFIDHDLDKAAGGTEEADIPVSGSDPLEAFKSNLGYIPFDRDEVASGTGTSPSNPRQFINELPSFIDGFDIYGGEQKRLEWLRTGPDNGNPAEAGAELMLPNDYFPRATARGSGKAELENVPSMALEGSLVEEPQEAVVTGDIRGNENSELTGTMLLMAREHNRIVRLLPNTLSNEEKFQIARLVVGAEIEYVTYREFLPALGITLAPYRGYDPSVNPSVALEFATVGYRLHSLVNGEEELEVGTSQYSPAQLEELESRGVGVTPIETFEGNKPGYLIVIPQTVAFFDPDITETLGLGPELEGLSTGPDAVSYRNDEQITEELRSALFQIPTAGRTTGFECFNEPELPECYTGVSDLGAIDVQRGFDHGEPSYNMLRKAYGLAPQETFDEVTGDSGSEELPTGDTINTPAINEFVSLENYWHEPVPLDSPENATYDTKRTTVAQRLKAIYGSVNNLDAFTGMLSEPTHPGTVGGEIGELQEAILRKQFEAVRDGDRFFYLNDLPALRWIRHRYGITYRHSLAQLESLDAGVPRSQLKRDVFFAARPPHQAH
jgi:Animal haem peroxidase